MKKKKEVLWSISFSSFYLNLDLFYVDKFMSFKYLKVATVSQKNIKTPEFTFLKIPKQNFA